MSEAARSGVDLAGLGGLAQEMYERSYTYTGRDDDDADSLGDRAVWLDTTLGGAGRLTGDLTAGCSAALAAVLSEPGRFAGRNVALICSGGNISPAQLAALLA